MTNPLRSLSLAAVLLSSTAGAACDVGELAAQQAEVGSFDRALRVNGHVNLDVRTGSGGVQVRTGPGDTVRVIGRIRARSGVLDDSPAARIGEIERNPPIQQEGNTIRIGATQDTRLYNNISISYEITVPADADIRSTTGSGSQVIGSVRGSVTAEAGSGTIEIAETGGDVRARTGSGSINIERSGGALDAVAGSGSIHVRAVNGAIRAQTGSGEIDMVQTAPADADLRTGSGSVRLGLPDRGAFEFSGQTGSGSIEVAHQMNTRVQSRHRVEGSVGSGGAKVNVMTGSGSITIR